MEDHVSYLTKFWKHIASKEHQINMQEQEVTIKMDEINKLFQPACAICIPASDDGEVFDPTYSTKNKSKFDEPLFHEFIKQDIALLDPSTHPHQTYLEVVQRQDNIKHERIKLDRRDNAQTNKTDQQITK